MKETPIPPSFRRHQWLTCIVLVLGCMVCAIIIGFNNYQRLELAIHRRAWESVRPPAYYMVVDENWVPKGSWLWAISVQGGRPTSVKLLKSFEVSPGRSGVSGPSVTTVERAFEFGQGCARSVLDCRLEFDPQYHFPRRVGYSDGYDIEVKQFAPCGASVDTCPSFEQLPAK